jgi:peptide-methionine (S)-S-oxide reductase
MMDKKTEEVVFGGGCFWCTEAVFKMLKGVVSVTSGYAGGNVENPSYEQVHTGETGHAEVVRVEYRPDEIGFWELLEVFFSAHDPTTLNRQSDDIGEQYRSVIFYTTDNQGDEAISFIEELDKSGEFVDPVVTEAKPLDEFYEAGEGHKDYYTRNPKQAYCQLVIAPKVKKIRTKHSKLLKK